jgi:hypothetical protein
VPLNAWRLGSEAPIVSDGSLHMLSSSRRQMAGCEIVSRVAHAAPIWEPARAEVSLGHGRNNPGGDSGLVEEPTPTARYTLSVLAEDAITTDQRKAMPAYHRWAVLLSPSRRWFGHYYRGWLGPCVTSEAPAIFLNEINTCRNIKAMVSMAKQNGIQVILATIPPGLPRS